MRFDAPIRATYRLRPTPGESAEEKAAAIARERTLEVPCGAAVLRSFDLDAACRSRELRNAVWEIYDLIRDREQATVRMADRVDIGGGPLEQHRTGAARHEPVGRIGTGAAPDPRFH